jgi:hypothetical protein
MRRKAGERGVSSDEDPSPESSWSGDVASAVVDWSEMSGSSSSSPPHAVEVSSSWRPQTAARDKNVGSSSRQAAHPVQEDQQTVRPCAAPSGTGATGSQSVAPHRVDPPRRSEERPAPTRQLYDGSNRPDSDSLQRRRSQVKSLDSASTSSTPQAAPAVVTYPRRWSHGCPCFPHPGWEPRTTSSRRWGRRVSPRADRGASSRRRGGRPKRSSPQAGGPETRSP